MSQTPDLFLIQRYDDAMTAIEWLERAFGFEREFVVPGENGTVTFAGLSFQDDVFGTGTKRPDVDHAICFRIEDPDAHYERAKAAGAEIVEAPHDEDHGRFYVCRDIDGHMWSFGSHGVPKEPGCDIAPVVGYRDVWAGIRFMVEAFGLEEREVYKDDAGNLVHAEIGLGHGVVMPTTTDGSKGDDNPWGRTNFGFSVTVDDPDAHHARAVAAGAEIVSPLEDTDYGARGYSVRDLEGHLWHFGTYRPAGTRA
jgi:uncharacterized glyoxalase superfamily protein PhnB